MSLQVVILSAGQGKRMRSTLPKVLHQLAGKPLLRHIIETVQRLNPTNIMVVYGHAGEQIRAALTDLPVQWIEQKEQLGTGHALLQAVPYLDNHSRVLVLFADVPLVSVASLQQLLLNTPSQAVGVLTAQMINPAGLGRIVRNAAQQMIAVIEEKDASAEQRLIQEINTGIAVVPAEALARWLPTLTNHNAQAEYYYPEIFTKAVAESIPIYTAQVMDPAEGQGVNDREQLAQLERFYQEQQAKKFMREGVTIIDPKRFDVRGTAKIAADVTIDINVILEGNIIIGTNSVIGANTILRNVTIGAHVIIKANTIIEDAVIENNAQIGPFARIRPGTHLKENVHVGNFVEIKNSTIEQGSKINHLSYIGDATIGKQANIGAGTITCNYDGANKHKTVIGDNVFIGSNTSLIAPVTIGAYATVGAGSTINRSVDDGQLAVTRSEQRTIANWRRPTKKKEQE